MCGFFFFLELSCFSDDPVDVGNLISGSSAFSKTNLNIWKFRVHVLLKSAWKILGITLLKLVFFYLLKTLLMKVKQESENDGFKLNIHKTKIMASGPITSWENDEETVDTVSDFIFWAPKSL